MKPKPKYADVDDVIASWFSKLWAPQEFHVVPQTEIEKFFSSYRLGTRRKLPDDSVYDSFYKYLGVPRRGGDAGMDCNRVFVGVDTMKRLRLLTAARFRLRFPKATAAEIRVAVNWHDFGSGPRETMGHRRLRGPAIVVTAFCEGVAMRRNRLQTKRAL